MTTKQRQDYIQFLLTRKKNPPRLRETKPRGMNAALLPEPARPTFKIEWKRPKEPKPASQGYWRSNPFGLSLGEEQRRVQWIGEGNEFRESHLVAPKRTARPSPLHRIAEQLLVKPKRVTRLTP